MLIRAIVILDLAAHAFAEDHGNRPARMNAIGLTSATGGIHLLEEFECDTPMLRPRDVLVKVMACAMNPIDTKIRNNRGNPGLLPQSKILGYDGAGIVQEVGESASSFMPGDLVYFAGSVIRNGSNAEFVAIDERLVARPPKTLSLTQAAALPLTAITAWEGLFERAGIAFDMAANQQKRLLVLPGAGGVGCMVIQLAKMVGLYVIGTASRTESSDAVKALGADLVINHQRPLKLQLVDAGLEGTASIDYIFNAHAITENVKQYVDIIKPFGKIIEIVPLPQVEIPLLALAMKSVAYLPGSMFTRSFHQMDMERQGDILARIADLVDSKVLQVKIHVTLPWSVESFKKAHAMQESGTAVGKIVLTHEPSAGSEPSDIEL